MLIKILATLLTTSAIMGCKPSSSSSLREDTPETSYAIYMALSQEPNVNDPDAYRILAKSTLPLVESSVEFCLSSPEKCTTDATQPRVAGVMQTVDGIDVYMSKSFVKMQNNLQITVFAKDATGASHQQTIKITTDPVAAPTATEL